MILRIRESKLHPLVKDLTGQRFSELTVIARAGSSIYPSRIAKWLCRCSCGKETVVYGTVLRNGQTRSCGHIWDEYALSGWSTKHGDNRVGRRTAEYRAWNMMKNRCYNQELPCWKHYGGRGIKVAPEWIDDFPAFLAHVGRKPSPKHSLDRWPNNDGNYEPGNVRWATWKEQANNKKTRESN